MKSQLLSIFSDTTNQIPATETPGEAKTGNARPGHASYHNRYQEFLNRQTPNSQPRSYRSSSPVRFLQGLVSFAVFVAMFLAILTLVGFGLSRLGVIARVSPSAVSASGKTNGASQDALPANPAPRKKNQRK